MVVLKESVPLRSHPHSPASVSNSLLKMSQLQNAKPYCWYCGAEKSNGRKPAKNSKILM
jgi:hypothetical protein